MQELTQGNSTKVVRGVSRNSGVPLEYGLGSVRLGDVVFCIGFAIYIVQYVLLSTTPLSFSSSYATLAVLLLMLFKVLITTIETRTIEGGGLLVVGLLFFLVVLTQVHSGTSQLTVLAAILLGSRHVHPRSVAKVAFWSIFTSVALVLFLMLAGYLPNAVFIQESRIRYSLGFTYVGMFDLYLLHLALLVIYLKGKNLHVGTVLVFLALHFVAYSQSVVRGTFAVSLLVWILYLLFIKRDSGRVGSTVLSVIAIASIPVCLAISTYTAIGYQPASQSWALVNELFSGRLRLAQLALLIYGVTPFGQIVTWVGSAAVQSGAYLASDYNYVDSGYLQVLIQFGWVTLAVVCAAYVLVAVSAARRRNRTFQVWVVAIAIECLIYPNLLLVAYNCLLVIAICTLGDKAKRSPLS